MTSEAAASRIKTWLAQDKLSFEEKSLEGDRFRFAIKDQRLNTEVFQPTALEDSVFIVCVIVFRSSDFQPMEASKRESLAWSIRLGLAQMGVEFEGVQMPLERVVVTNRIWYDGLSKDTFFSRWLEVRRSSLWLIWKVNEALGQEPQFPTTGGPVN